MPGDEGGQAKVGRRDGRVAGMRATHALGGDGSLTAAPGRNRARGT